MCRHNQGKFADALVPLRRGHELGSKQPGWSLPSAAWLKGCERRLELDTKLTDLVRPDGPPPEKKDCLELADLCAQYRKRYAAAVRFYLIAFESDPKTEADLDKDSRSSAISCAALAAAGDGIDAPDGELERARLRGLALRWSRAQLQARAEQLGAGTPEHRKLVRQSMESWQQDSNLKGLRDPAALAKLPDEERVAWQKLWTDVEELCNRAANGK
jgi:hypothetical protein